MKRIEIKTQIVLEIRRGVLGDNDELTYPVCLRLTHNRKQRYFTLRNILGKPLRLTKEDYSDLSKTRLKPEQKQLLLYLQLLEEKAVSVIQDLEPFSFTQFRIKFFEKAEVNSPRTIQELFKQKITELESNDKIQTSILYNSSLRSIESFNGRKLTFEAVTPIFLKKYEDYMIGEGNSYTTIGMYLKSLRAIINIAIDNKIISEYPFKKRPSEKDKYQIPVGNKKPKALSSDELKKLIEYKPISPQENKALKYWLFSYLCAGVNFADILELKHSNIVDNRLIFIRKKTKDTAKIKNSIDIPLSKMALDIIAELGSDNKPNNLIFTVYNSDSTPIEKHRLLKQHIKNTNKYIRRIATTIKINTNITTYWARHTYSTILKNKNVPIEYISRTLGHTDLKTTQNYLGRFEDAQEFEFNANLIPE